MEVEAEAEAEEDGEQAENAVEPSQVVADL